MLKKRRNAPRRPHAPRAHCAILHSAQQASLNPKHARSAVRLVILGPVEYAVGDEGEDGRTRDAPSKKSPTLSLLGVPRPSWQASSNRCQN